MNIEFGCLSLQQAQEIYSWRYQEPYQRYDFRSQREADVIDELTDPAKAFFAGTQGDELVGFRSFGADGRVSGGSYDDQYLDTGGGLAPEFVGIGLGEQWVRKGIEFGTQKYGTKRFRVTIAQFNQRALKVCSRVGFVEHHRFTREIDEEPFVVMVLG